MPAAKLRSVTKKPISQTPSAPYPKPGPVGGRLIREVKRLLKETGVSTPICSDILIAVSGGSDSVALLHLLHKFGRRVARADQIHAVHVNHGWRGLESDEDEAFVRQLCLDRQIPFHVRRLGVRPTKGESWEAHARAARKKLFHAWLAEGSTKREYIFTAHHADDLAETLVWRFFTGNAEILGEGIRAIHDREVRPLLTVRKEILRAFLREEGVPWREDRSNEDTDLLRNSIRKELWPVIEKIFPRAAEHLITYALQKQSSQPKDFNSGRRYLEELFSQLGVFPRQPHYRQLAQNSETSGALHLPGGWSLQHKVQKGRESWVLESNERQSKEVEGSNPANHAN